MKYLIAREVVYDTETATLTVNGSDSLESQKLTNIANRILSILLASPGHVIERSYLLDKVWGAVGHPGSSASLNQYISMLRKSLTSFTGVQETIISVPKVGFLFNPEIDVEILANKEIPETKNPASSGYKKHTVNLFLMMIIFVLLVANATMLSGDSGNSRYSILYDIGKSELCSLYSYEKVNPEQFTHLLDIVDTYGAMTREKCTRQLARLIIQVQRSYIYTGEGRVFWSFCPTHKEDNKVMYCESHYIYKRKAK